jgi:hypothetical protein
MFTVRLRNSVPVEECKNAYLRAMAAYDICPHLEQSKLNIAQ